MKKNLLSAIASLGLALFTQAQPFFANRNLSNLLSPTAVNQDLLPNSTNTRDLGSSSRNWKDLYLGGSIFKGSLRFLSNEGTQNTFLGISAGNAITAGSNSTALGYQALLSNTTGERNTAIGAEAILDNTEGSDNTGIGWQVLRGNTGGSNVAIGHGAGRNFHTSACTFLGTLSESLGLFANSTAIGYQTAITATDQVRVGNSSVTSIGGFADWTNFSDERYKKNIKEDVPGLAFITQLKPITYTLDIEGLEKTMKMNARHTGAGKPAVQPELSQQEIAAKKARAKEIHTGFVAQEVEAVAKKLNYSFNGVDAPKNDKDFYGLRYAEFVVPLVKAVQELDAENKKMKEELKELRQMILNLMNSNTNNSSPGMNMSGAYLEQNAPNPFNSTTIIRYNVPIESVSARIVITDLKGQLVKTIAVRSKGTNQIALSGGELVAGSYVYSLWVDGKQVDSKRMILTK
jgi:trimeric autotransporter adhesin